MPTSDLDMPLLPSADQIRRREFATVRRGYDPQQVRMYLTSIAQQVETLERELGELRLQTDAAVARRQPEAEPALAAPAGDPYELLGKRFASLIEVADQEAARMIDDARSEAARTLEEARTEADRIKVDAQARAEEARQEGADLLERAKIESDRVLFGLAERREDLLGQLHEMRSKLIAVAEGLAGPLEIATQPDADERGDDEIDGDGAVQGGVIEGDGAIPGQAEADPVDPRYEDLWVSPGSVDLPDLAAIDLDFDDPD
jgi:DivIVA domain-containing protein